MDKFKRNIFLAAMLSWISLLWGSAVTAADYSIDDAYLDSLAEEAGNLEFMDQAEQELRKTEEMERASSVSASSETQQAIRSIASFERILKEQHPSTFQLYKKLNTENRLTAFQALKRSNKLSIAKRRIMEMYRATTQ